MQTANYMKAAQWVHCLLCHKTYHKEDVMLHWSKLCPNAGKEATACLCKLPDVDYIPEREGLVWE